MEKSPLFGTCKITWMGFYGLIIHSFKVYHPAIVKVVIPQWEQHVQREGKPFKGCIVCSKGKRSPLGLLECKVGQHGGKKPVQLRSCKFMKTEVEGPDLYLFRNGEQMKGSQKNRLLLRPSFSSCPELCYLATGIWVIIPPEGICQHSLRPMLNLN